jgi:hypothetical protein
MKNKGRCDALFTFLRGAVVMILAILYFSDIIKKVSGSDQSASCTFC